MAVRLKNIYPGRYENSRGANQTPVAIGHWEMGTLRHLRERVATSLAAERGKSKAKDRAIRKGIRMESGSLCEGMVGFFARHGVRDPVSA